MYKMIGSDGQVYGPYTLEQLQEFVNQGRVTYNTQIILENEHRVSADQILNFNNGSYNANSNNIPYKNNVANKNMFDYIKICFNKYCDFSGRARRSEYWFFCLFNLIVQFLIGFVVGFLCGLSGNLDAIDSLCNVVCGIWDLVVLLPGLGVSVRRLHDIGKSGWNLLWCLTGIGAIVVIVWLCQDSNPGSNQWGSNPKA